LLAQKGGQARVVANAERVPSSECGKGEDITLTPSSNYLANQVEAQLRSLSATESTAKAPNECSKVFYVDATLKVTMLPSLRQTLLLALLGHSGRCCRPSPIAMPRGTMFHLSELSELRSKSRYLPGSYLGTQAKRAQRKTKP
jgi:hypothetical protein